jgi:hypothetical protein
MTTTMWHGTPALLCDRSPAITRVLCNTRMARGKASPPPLHLDA